MAQKLLKTKILLDQTFTTGETERTLQWVCLGISLHKQGFSNHQVTDKGVVLHCTHLKFYILFFHLNVLYLQRGVLSHADKNFKTQFLTDQCMLAD